MRAIAAAILLSLASLGTDTALAQSCTAKPDSSQFYMAGPDFYNAQNCPPAQSFTFTLTKRTTCYPWYVPCPGYTIQSCDDIEWSFGDGATAQTRGVPSISHAWTTPGLYMVKAKVTNANGSATVEAPILVAMQPPAYVSFAQEQFTAREDAGVVNIVLNRTGDLSRSITIQYRNGWTLGVVERNMEIVAGSVTFAPGESVKTFPLRVVDDDAYNGDQQHWLEISNDTGAVLLKQSIRDSCTIRILENDAAPRASIGPSTIRVVEGDRGQDVLVRIPITLSQAFAQELHFEWGLWEGTARRESDFRSTGPLPVWGSVVIPAGQTAAEFTVAVLGDDTPEPDESFTVSVIRSGGPPLLVEGSPIAVTIADDDLAFNVESLQIAAGEWRELVLESGSANGGNAFTVTSSDDTVAAVPQQVTIAASGSRAAVMVEAKRPGTATIRAALQGTSKATGAAVYVHQAAQIRFTDVTEQIAVGASGSFTLGVELATLPVDAVLLVDGPGAIEIATRLTVGTSGATTVTFRGVRPGLVTITALIQQPYGATSASRTIEVRAATAPVLSRIDPASGSTGGGTAVTIKGDRFTSDCRVTFDGLFASSTTSNAQTIVATAPPHAAGTVDVAVTCGSESATLKSAYRYQLLRRRSL